VHRAHLIQQWVAQHSDQLELFYLPSYSPERNPDEYLIPILVACALDCELQNSFNMGVMSFGQRASAAQIGISLPAQAAAAEPDVAPLRDINWARS
jgi:hypothetical protein